MVEGDGERGPSGKPARVPRAEVTCEISWHTATGLLLLLPLMHTFREDHDSVLFLQETTLKCIGREEGVGVASLATGGGGVISIHSPEVEPLHRFTCVGCWPADVVAVGRCHLIEQRQRTERCRTG